MTAWEAFSKAFNKPNAFRTGSDEAVLTVAGWIIAIIILAAATVGYLLYLNWKDKKERTKRPRNL